MTRRPAPAPRSETLGAGQTGPAGDAGNAADATPQYTTAVSPGIPPITCPRLVTWLRCRACQQGYFAASAPSPQPCPACKGRLQPVALWDLRRDLAPPGGMMRRWEAWV